MALFCASRRLLFGRICTHQPKIDLQFHTLRKIDYKVITKIRNGLLIPKRNFFWIFKRRTVREIRLVDKPPKNYELIYRCAFDHYILTCQYFGFFAAVTSFGLAVYQSCRFYQLPTKKKEYLGDGLIAGKPITDAENEQMAILAAFVFVFCFLNFVIGRLPVRIYCYPQREKYLFYYYGVIPNQLKKVSLKAGEIKRAISNSMNPWNQDLYENTKTGQRSILLENYFKCPADLYILLGLQKDPDINYDYEDPDEKSTKKKLEDK